MKAGLCCLLLLAGCMEPEFTYQYALEWTCLSPGGCERTEDVELIDRLNVQGNYIYFHSRQDTYFVESAQRLASDSLPAGCAWIYAISFFAYELESSTICSTAGGFELKLSIPNLDSATHSEWLVEARALGR
jgi:hypothetical protein